MWVTYSELKIEKTLYYVKTNVEAYLHYNLQASWYFKGHLNLT